MQPPLLAFGQYYKTFYGRNCRRIVITSEVCHYHSFPPSANICSQGWNLPLVESRKDKHSSLLRYGNNYVRKRFYSIDHCKGILIRRNVLAFWLHIFHKAERYISVTNYEKIQIYIHFLKIKLIKKLLELFRTKS
jgi:hypothetical protein